jgi:hypothetical protein
MPASLQQEFRDRRSTGPKVARAPMKLRRDHAGPQRVHPGEEGFATGRANFHSIVLGPALSGDAVDIGCFSQRHTPVVGSLPASRNLRDLCQ